MATSVLAQFMVISMLSFIIDTNK